MIVSFFSENNYTTGVDYSGHPQLVHQEDIEFDPSTQIATLEGGKIKIKQVEQVEQEETQEQKFERVFQKLVNLPTLDASTDQSVLEGLVFSDKQKGDLIVSRVFKDPVTGEPNPHFQTALLAKKLLGNNDPEFLQMLQHTQQQTDAILAFFHMGAL